MEKIDTDFKRREIEAKQCQPPRSCFEAVFLISRNTNVAINKKILILICSYHFKDSLMFMSQFSLIRGRISTYLLKDLHRALLFCTQRHG